MLLTFVNKDAVNSVFTKSLDKEGIEYSDFSSRPTPLNSILWDAVAETNSNFLLGYYTLLSDNENVKWKTVAKNHSLMEPYKDQPEWDKLKRFTGGEYAVEGTATDTIKIHDLRFGKIQFPDGNSDWVFTFYALPQPDGTITFSQKELPSEKFDFDDMKQVFSVLWNSILGKDVLVNE